MKPSNELRLQKNNNKTKRNYDKQQKTRKISEQRKSKGANVRVTDLQREKMRITIHFSYYNAAKIFPFNRQETRISCVYKNSNDK